MTDLATGALAPLHNRDFRFLLAGFAIGQMLMPLQFITQILWVQSTAPNNIWLILVAFIATSRGLGALTFGLYGGALADRFNRKHLLQLILGLQVITTAAIAGLCTWISAGCLDSAPFSSSPSFLQDCKVLMPPPALPSCRTSSVSD